MIEMVKIFSLFAKYSLTGHNLCDANDEIIEKVFDILGKNNIIINVNEINEP